MTLTEKNEKNTSSNIPISQAIFYFTSYTLFRYLFLSVFAIGLVILFYFSFCHFDTFSPSFPPAFTPHFFVILQFRKIACFDKIKQSHGSLDVIMGKYVNKLLNVKKSP